MISVNSVTPTMISRIIIPRMLQRKHKSGIIFTSSLVSSGEYIYMSVYSATKAY